MRTRNRTAPGATGRLQNRSVSAVADEVHQGDLYMQLETTKEALTDQLAAPTTRRTIVKTGVKLGYAIPLVAATYKLTASGALAACGGDTPFELNVPGIDTPLCCGCCDASDSGIGGPVEDAFNACQAILVANGITCPLPGQPGDDETRVCISFNIASR